MVGDLGALALEREHGAGLDGDAVDMHDAGAALGGVAADMRAGEPQVLAQELHQQRARFDSGCTRHAPIGALMCAPSCGDDGTRQTRDSSIALVV